MIGWSAVNCGTSGSAQLSVHACCTTTCAEGAGSSRLTARAHGAHPTGRGRPGWTELTSQTVAKVHFDNEGPS